jgi:SpoVK/Ycf46/Vps4 family AAA+-type ATPase
LIYIPSLRHIEYYRGILFLTTNRLAALDEAFLSHVHVAMHFPELSEQSRQQVWAAFINKLGTDCSEDMTQSQIGELAKRYTNGRQIKNAVRTAQSLAAAGDQKVKFAHFVEALDAMEGSTKGWTFRPVPPAYPVIYGL